METCDRHILAKARWVVFLDNGPLFLCNHCWEKHKANFVLKYRFTDLWRADVPAIGGGGFPLGRHRAP